MSEKRKRIAIVGGNFAGLTAAIKFSRHHVVTVIDPSEYFEWLPNIHEILSGVKTPQGLRLDRTAIVEQAGHRFLRDRVTVLQPAQCPLATAGGRELGFDACIVAVGALWNTPHTPGVDRYATPFRSVADALAIERRSHMLVQQGKPLRIAIAGGGISGIEALGEIRRRHRDDARLSVELVEASAHCCQVWRQQWMPIFATCASVCGEVPHRHDDCQRVAKGRGLADGTRLRSELTLWTAGPAPPALLGESGLARPPQVWADVHQTLQSRYFDNTFVVGDAAQMAPSGVLNSLPAAIGRLWQSWHKLASPQCCLWPI